MKNSLKRSLLKIPFVPSIASAWGVGGARLRALSDLPKRGVGAEIGVHIGDFSAAIMSVAKPRKLYLIDPWKCFESEEYESSWYGNRVDQNTMDDRYSGVCERFKNAIFKGQLEVLRSESRAALGELDDNSLDFVYIDGDHTYEGVKEDLEISLSKVKDGGVITGDDYGPGSWWEGGVKRAVDEFGWNESVKLQWIEGTQFFFRKGK